MPAITLEKPQSPAAAPSAASAAGAQRPPGSRPASLLIGLDLVTNKSCILAGGADSTDITVSKVVPSVVGYAKDGIVDCIITGNVQVLYGDDALRQRLHV